MNKVFEATDDLNELIGKYSYGVVNTAFSKIKEKEEGEVEKTNFSLQCRSYGLKPEYYGLVFRAGNDAFKVCGIKPANRKYPILASRVKDGKGFKFTPDQVKFSPEGIKIS